MAVACPEGTAVFHRHVGLREKLTRLLRFLPKSGREHQQELEPEERGRLLRPGPHLLNTTRALALSDLYRRQLLCDAVVRLADGGFFLVHRVVLSTCSMYFRTLFTTKLHTVCKTDVLIPGVTTEEMRLILDYAYLRPLPLNEANVYRMLVVADYLCVTGLHDLCTDLLISMLSPSNCIHIMLFARQPSCTRLERAARRYALRHFPRVEMETDALLCLPAAELGALLSTDWLNARSEQLVWCCVLRWTAVNPAARMRYLPLLMRCVRLGLLDVHFFQRNVKSHPYVEGNRECRPVMLEALMLLYRRENPGGPAALAAPHPLSRPRVPYEVVLAIGGWTGDGSTACFEMYNTRTDQWTEVWEEDPAGPRAYHDIVVIGSDVYVIGGFNGRTVFRSCRCFNAAVQEWREVAPMNFRRCYVSAAALGELIYAIGGYDGEERLRTVECFDHYTNQWSLVCPMNAPRSDATAVALDGRLYVAGGFDGQNYLQSVEVYSPVTDQWTLIRPMRFPRSGVAGVAYYGCLYVVGGNNGYSRLRSVERYDPATGQWALIPEMYTPRSNHGIAVIDDMIFAVGGYDGTSTVSYVECYSPSANEWYGAANLNVRRSALAACVVSAPELPPPRDSWWQLSMASCGPCFRREDEDRALMRDVVGDSRNCQHAA
ncbi:kelch-like protein 10 [Schistocerca serialis cubense]|uniref:kelch-like protein 10 n=1 Tax=Schistocerca serialis cubense TaxID=2023355 RepID=UPI00214E883A|nr:kelch-like protein 10 [Schistocerca serialis cubense]